jgi:hypothetical protein
MIFWIFNRMIKYNRSFRNLEKFIHKSNSEQAKIRKCQWIIFLNCNLLLKCKSKLVKLKKEINKLIYFPNNLTIVNYLNLKRLRIVSILRQDFSQVKNLVNCNLICNIMKYLLVHSMYRIKDSVRKKFNRNLLCFHWSLLS